MQFQIICLTQNGVHFFVKPTLLYRTYVIRDYLKITLQKDREGGFVLGVTQGQKGLVHKVVMQGEVGGQKLSKLV